MTTEYYAEYPENIINRFFSNLPGNNSNIDNKNDYLLSSNFINDIFWDYQNVTNEKTSLDCFKKIIIPKFSQHFCSKNLDMIYSYNFFNSYKQLIKNFLLDYEKYFAQIQFTKNQPLEKTNSSNKKINLSTIDEIYEHMLNYMQKFINNGIVKLSFHNNGTEISNLIEIVEKNPLNSKLLADYLIWSIFNSNLVLMLKILKKSINFQNPNSVIFHSSFGELFDNDMTFSEFIFIPEKKISMRGLKYNSEYTIQPDQNIFIATSNGVFTLIKDPSHPDSENHVLTIALNYRRTNRNVSILSINKNAANCRLLSVDNCLLMQCVNNFSCLGVFNKNMAYNWKYLCTKELSSIEMPLTSDGHFIYQICLNNTINVYSIDHKNYTLITHKSIQINENAILDEAYNDKIFSNSLIQNGFLFTNGYVIQIIKFEKTENNKFIYFVRSVSLVTGNHIKDQRFECDYRISSICFEPLTRSIWILEKGNKDLYFDKYNYNGPDPLWLSYNNQINYSQNQNIDKFSHFTQFIVDFLHSNYILIFGIQNIEYIPKCLLSSNNQELIKLIFDFLSMDNINTKIVQFLFILLSYQFKYNKIQQEDADLLYSYLEKYIKIPSLYIFLTLFIIQITDNCHSIYVSKYFGLVFLYYNNENYKIDFIIGLLLRLKDSKKLPYVLYNNCSIFLYKLLDNLHNNRLSISGYNFLLNYQHSIFSNYVRIQKENPQKLEKIESVILEYSLCFICKAICFLKNFNDIYSFQCSDFFDFFKKFSLYLRLIIYSPKALLAILPILLELLKEIHKSTLFQENGNNYFYWYFMNFFDLFTNILKNILSCSNVDILKKHFIFLKCIVSQEKTIVDVFKNQINESDFLDVMKGIYSKIPNPLNKHITQDDIDLEKLLFLSFIYKTNKIDEIKSLIKESKDYQISPSIRQIIQAIYKIRSKLKFHKQKQSNENYLHLKNNYIEKAHFLLKTDSDELNLKEILNFYDDETQIPEIIKEQKEFEMIKNNFSLSFQMINSFLLENFSKYFVYLFIMEINDSSIVSIYELVGTIVEIDIKTSIITISKLLEKTDGIPFNAILSFLCNFIIMLTESSNPAKTHDLIFLTIANILIRLCNEYKNMPNYMFKSCITFICHFNRILNDEKLFTINKNEKVIVSEILQMLNMNSALSLSLNYSLTHGLFNVPKSFDFFKSFIGFVSQPKFHSMSLMMYDVLEFNSGNSNEDEFLSGIKYLLNIIGAVLSGAYSDNLLQIAVPIPLIEQIKDNAYIRTSSSQISCALELVQIIRKLILTKNSKASNIIINYFKLISENIKFDDPYSMKQVYGMIAILSKNFKLLRRYSIAKTKENKKYLITSYGNSDLIKGVLLPISKESTGKHELLNIIDINEPIQLDSTLFDECQILLSLITKSVKSNIKMASDSLYSFYSLQCIKENILFIENNDEFSRIILDELKRLCLPKYRFTNHSKNILSLVKKMLEIPTNGVFSNDPVKIQLYPVSFTKIMFNNDFELTESMIKTGKSPHVFISSIINNENPCFFSINVDNINQCFQIGIISHSIDKNKVVSYVYSSIESQIICNGKNIFNYHVNANNLIEFCYLPSQNKVIFSSSQSDSLFCSFDLENELPCSFLALVYPETELKYNLGLVPQTKYFIDNFQKLKNQNQSHVYYNRNIYKEIIQYSSLFNEIEFPSNDIFTQYYRIDKSFYSFTKLNKFPKAHKYMDNYPNAYYYSQCHGSYTTPFILNNSFVVDEVSGKLCVRNIQYLNKDAIPTFNCNEYSNIPPEILNYYIKEACEYHKEEILTFLLIRTIVNSKEIYTIISSAFNEMSGIVNFITSILLLLEPIKLEKLNDDESPIDFNSFNSFESCYNTNLYNYYSALNKIIGYYNQNEKEKFVKIWFNQLKKDFHNELMHFASKDNNNLIITKKLIMNSYKTLSAKNVSKWIVFPFKFGCYKIDNVYVNDNINLINSEMVNYGFCEGENMKIKLIINKYKIFSSSLGILPFYEDSNESLLDSFFQLAVSFKYFVLFAQNNLTDDMSNNIWENVLTSIISGSPFFYSHSNDIISFLKSKIKINMLPENIKTWNKYIAINSTLAKRPINKFMNLISTIINIQKAKEIENIMFHSKDSIDFKIGKSLIPRIIDLSSDTENLLNITKQVLLHKNNSDFPYYLIINEWLESIFFYPPCDIEIVKPNIISITFLEYIPLYIKIKCNQELTDKAISISFNNDLNTESFKNICCITGNDLCFEFNNYQKIKTIYVKFNGFADVSNLSFLIYSDPYQEIGFKKRIDNCQQFLINDLNAFCNEYSIEDDHQIINNINFFYTNFIDTRLNADKIFNLNNKKHRPHLNYLRSIYLYTINYLFLNDKLFSEFEHNEELSRFISYKHLSRKFYDLIQISSYYEKIQINRKIGLDYRNGINKDIKNSMIGQFARKYVRKINHFRNEITPFKIDYINEIGIDAGGLMRDYITEMICDINTPNVGLFIQTPNGRNHIGKYQDCIIPIPSPNIGKSSDIYKAIGGLLAIIVRTKIKQSDLLFPPLFWKYMVKDTIDIEDVYEIDEEYKKLTSNILQAANEMNDNEFETFISSINILSFNEIPMNLNGLSEKVTKMNCNKFICVCNENRLKEICSSLKLIKLGFWDNLNITVPHFISPSLIKSFICSEKVITVEYLKKITHFRGISNTLINYYWEMVSKLNNDERKKLIRFATGLNSLNNEGIYIDFYETENDTHLPKSSTCFFTLHLPPFSSAEKMYEAFRIAINETGTFENY